MLQKNVKITRLNACTELTNCERKGLHGVVKFDLKTSLPKKCRFFVALHAARNESKNGKKRKAHSRLVEIYDTWYPNGLNHLFGEFARAIFRQ